MRRFDLGMSLNYVSNWTSVEAIREIFQNALDAEVVNPENKMSYSYDSDSQILRICNKKGVLSTSSLLLGCSSKRDNADTIGSHGEGYKVATIVLLREGLGLKIYNYSLKEEWVAKIVNSRRYGDKVGQFEISKYHFIDVPHSDLVFEISGVTEELYAKIKDSNLHLQDVGKYVSTPKGRILLEERFAGRIFVNGLYVCTKEQCHYGYDLVPSLIQLDRDRGLIDSFNLQWSLGKLFASSDDIDLISKAKDYWDGYYLRMFLDKTKSNFNELFDKAYFDFTKKYGSDAHPCSTTEEFNTLKRCGYNAVMVNENKLFYITSSPSYKSTVKIDTNSLEDSINTWLDKIKPLLPDEIYDEGRLLIKELLERG